MIVILLLTTILITYFYLFFNIKHSHWRKKGVKGPRPLPFVGNFGRLMMQQQSITQLAEEAYKQYPDEKFVGMYCGFTPVLLLRDPAIINHILTKGFNNFNSRGVRTAETGFSNNLLIAEGDTWKNIRQKITPAFTATKLKEMIPLIHEKVGKLMKQVEVSIDSEENCDVKELATRYAMELICSCGFGLNLDFYSPEMKELYEFGKESITPSLFFRLWYVAEMLIPGIHSMFPAIDPTAHIREFFIKLVKYIISERKKLKETRHDIMEVFIKLLEEDDNSDIRKIHEPKTDVNFIASQIFVLYATAFETSSSTLSYLLYELSMHEKYQETAYIEICEVLKRYDGVLTYDSINEMTYLRKIFNETLRKYPFVGWIIRKTREDYLLPETNITVKAGTIILASIKGLHSDAKYFQDPDVFNPENFSKENFSYLSQSAFIPFGAGPRNCIGYRFATQHIMMAAAAFLSRYKVDPCKDKQKEVSFDSISITQTPVNGIWIKVSKRN